MILSDVLGAAVLDAEGKRLGVVSDLRFVLQGGPEALLAAPRLVGVLVSPRTASSFLGYERQGINQPWPIAQILSWRHRGSFLVLWDDLASLGPESVRLRKGYTAYEASLRA
ncbi:PRC-barrel domain-containing protein [Sinomonas flava]|uniref:PRC-barrel domain-containing protein n=1 Tax=Sinomonas flava TaxID=496857 RepID=UPI0039A4177B